MERYMQVLSLFQSPKDISNAFPLLTFEFPALSMCKMPNMLLWCRVTGLLDKLLSTLIGQLYNSRGWHYVSIKGNQYQENARTRPLIGQEHSGTIVHYIYMYFGAQKQFFTVSSASFSYYSVFSLRN